MAGGRSRKKSKVRSSDDFKDPSQDDGARYIQGIKGIFQVMV